MPKLTVNNQSVDVEQGKRLVLAIEETGLNIGHRCGGYARCTTCRVEVLEGDNGTYTEAEYLKLKERGLLGQYHLSCQMICDRDLNVRPAMTKESEGWEDTGPAPDSSVTPEATWFPLTDLEQRSA